MTDVFGILSEAFVPVIPVNKKTMQEQYQDEMDRLDAIIEANKQKTTKRRKS